MEFFNNLIDLSLEAAPWLVLGLTIAGVLKSVMTDSKLQKWLSKDNWQSPVLAAFLGAPLPLCSCGVLPVAIGLRQNGASKGTTVSFLVSTPENGVDSVSVSYALLGPIMAIIRPIAGISLAITAGLLTHFFDKKETAHQSATTTDSCCSSKPKAESSCCSSSAPKAEPEVKTSCCSSNSTPAKKENEIVAGLKYSFGKLWQDIYGWLIVGIVVAALVQTFVPPEVLVELGYSWLGLFAMLAIGVPIYICATASTPIAAALIASGLSPGAALVFLLAGPATNIGSIGLLKQELGTRSVSIYLGVIAVGSLLMGYALNQLLLATGWQIIPNIGEEHGMLPIWLEAVALSLLVLFTIFKIKPAQA